MKRVSLLTLTLLFHFSLIAAPVTEAIRQIPPEDRELLSVFFRGLLSQGAFAMTLFGQKSSTSFDYPDQLILRFGDLAMRTRFIWESKGWRVWEKHQKLFDIKKFSFIKCDSHYRSIVFVNHEAMKSVLTDHHDFFVNYFSRDPLKEQLDAFLESAFRPNFDASDFHIMQGLLLGYQNQNCKDFQERQRIEGTLAYFPYETGEDCMECSVSPDRLLDGYPQDLVKKRLQYKEGFSMKRKWQESNPFFCTTAPGHFSFHVPYDPSVDELKQKIADLYNSDQFLEDLLAILTK